MITLITFGIGAVVFSVMWMIGRAIWVASEIQRKQDEDRRL